MGWNLRSSLALCQVVFAALLAASLAHGQEVSPAQPQTVVDVLHQLSDKADVIFVGEVLAVRHPNDGVFEVEFRVDQAIRGCAGASYVLREWAGLWAGGTQRYRAGERLLMLLHAPSAAGMSSPVGGLNGAIPVRQGGGGAVTELVGTVVPQQPPFVDLRWLGARLPRAISYRSTPAPVRKISDVPIPFIEQQRTASMATAGSITNAGIITPTMGTASSTEGSVAAQQASVTAVVDMLTTWQKARHVSP
jgi:hypothetical protein